jgi:hypothetical protein
MLDTSAIFEYIDSVKDLVQDAQARHFQKWPILGMSGPAPEIGAIASTYNAELDTLKHWIKKRIIWLDANIPGICAPASSDFNIENPATKLSCYPNPGTGVFHFEGFLDGNLPTQMIVSDVAGKTIHTIKLSPGIQKFDYQLYTKGIYFFSIRTNNRILQYGKLIVL